MITASVPASDRAAADKLDPITDGNKIHDLLVSCYVGTGEDGRPEQVHERRLSDGSCRCGYYRLRRFPIVLTEDNGSGWVASFTWGTDYRHAVARVREEIARSPEVWAGWSFEVSRTPDM